MQKLFIPFLFDESSHVVQGNRTCKMFSDGLTGYPTKEQALDAAKSMSLGNPKGKVVIFESSFLIEPRKVEFVEKKYNDQGELIA